LNNDSYSLKQNSLIDIQNNIKNNSQIKNIIIKEKNSSENEKGDNNLEHIFSLINKIINMEKSNKSEIENTMIENRNILEKIFRGIDNNKKEIKKQKEEIEVLNEGKIKTEEKMKKQEEKMKKQEKEIITLKEKSIDQEEEIRALNEKNINQKEEIEKNKKKIETLNEEIKKEKEERIEEMENERNDLENKLNDQKLKTNNLEKKQKKTKLLFEKLEKKNQQSEKEIEELKKKIIGLKNDSSTNKKIIKKLETKSEELDKIKEEQKLKDIKINELIEHCKDLETTLGEIQFRKLSKNFLKHFECFLTKDDKKKIEEDSTKKNDIILSRFIDKFSYLKNENIFKITSYLIKKSGNLLKSGNNNAHSISLKKYQNNISKYKKENNVIYLQSPKIFIFCTNLDLDNYKFKETFELVDSYFDNNLYLKSEKYEEFYSIFKK